MTLMKDVVLAHPVPEELHHDVRLWTANGALVWTHSINGLCFTVAMRDRPFGDDRRLKADGADYYGDEAIRRWVEENLPLSMKQAREIIARRRAA